MSIVERNTPREFAYCIRNNILSGLLSSQQDVFKGYEKSFRNWCNDPYYHANRIWIGMSIFEEGMRLSIGYQKMGSELEDLSFVSITPGERTSAEINYESVSRVLSSYFGFKPLRESEIDSILCALADLVME